MKRIAWLLGVEAAAIAAALTVSLDLRAHGRVEALGGVNVWGYRGPVAHQRQHNEIRVAVVGGTRAFGWGAPASALVAELRRVIMLTTDRAGAEVRPVVAINLGRLGALPDSYPEIIEHFSYLRPDYICLYDDLGVRGGSPTSGTDGTSAVYQMTGYAPALPLVLREKGMTWRLGDVQRGYASPESEPDARASRLRRAAGATLEAVGDTLSAADRRLSLLVSRNRSSPPRRLDAVGYADAMMAAVESARGHARGVVVVVSPSDTTEQAANLRAFKARLESGIGSARWLRLVDLAGDAGLSSDPELRLDGWNYASAGIARVANRIAPALLSLIPTS